MMCIDEELKMKPQLKKWKKKTNEKLKQDKDIFHENTRQVLQRYKQQRIKQFFRISDKLLNEDFFLKLN